MICHLLLSSVSVHHHPGVFPVELLAGHWESSSHSLEHIAHALVTALNLVLIVRLRLVDRSDNAFSIGALQWNARELLLETEVNVAVLEVVIVDLDRSGKLTALRVDEPGGLPFAAPERVEVRVDAANVDLQVAVLVEAQTGARRPVTIVL